MVSLDMETRVQFVSDSDDGIIKLRMIFEKTKEEQTESRISSCVIWNCYLTETTFSAFESVNKIRMYRCLHIMHSLSTFSISTEE